MAKKKKSNNSRVILIDSRTRNKKKEFYFIVIEYRPGALSDDPEFRYDYPAFRKKFPTKSAARKYAIDTAIKLEKQYKNMRFLTRFLYD